MRLLSVCRRTVFTTVEVKLLVLYPSSGVRLAVGYRLKM
jgi:hypothetical protein